MSKIENKFDNFKNAVKRLNEANTAYKKDRDNSLYRDSIIKRFEFSFELAWKALREFIFEQGYKLEVASPKNVISFAYCEGFLSDEQIWLDMLKSRNNTAHEYGDDLSREIADTISTRYCKEIQKLCKFISDNIN